MMAYVIEMNIEQNKLKRNPLGNRQMHTKCEKYENDGGRGVPPTQLLTISNGIFPSSSPALFYDDFVIVLTNVDVFDV